MISSNSSEYAGSAIKHLQKVHVCYHKKKTDLTLSGSAIVVVEVETKIAVEIF